MVGVQVVFAVVVSLVFRACIPVVMELVLGGMVIEPLKAHINHFGLAGNNCFIGNTCGVELSVSRGLFGWDHAI